MNYTIPRLSSVDEPGPGWRPVVDGEGRRLKPIVKCQCGDFVGLGAHHVHADGKVTPSLYHPDSDSNIARGGYRHCGWHVYVTLADYDDGEFPPVAKP